MRRAVPARIVGVVLGVVPGVVPGVVLGVVLVSSPAAAHTSLVSATPSSGSTLDGVPAAVELDFSTPLQARLAQVVVRDAQGNDHVVGPVASFDSRVQAGVEGLRAGRYTVDYRVVAADGHPVVGSYAFVVAPGAAPTPGSAAGAIGDAAATAGRPWLVPLLGAFVVALAAGLRIRHGGRVRS